MDYPQPGVSREQELCRDFGATLASEHLVRKHGLQIGREALRQLMTSKPAYGAASAEDRSHSPMVLPQSKSPSRLSDLSRALLQPKSCRRLLNIACARRPSACCRLRFLICNTLCEVAVEGAVLAVHFIPRFVVFALAFGRPFRLDKTVTHATPFTSAATDIAKWLTMHIVRFSVLNNLEGEAISAHAPKGPESTSDSARSLPEPVLAAFQMCHELAILNAHGRLEVQAPHNRREIQVVSLAELSRT